MPRPDKDIRPGQLDGPVTPSRSHSWTKYGTAETVGGHRGAPSSIEESAADVSVTVDDITVTEQSSEVASKYTTRGTPAHGVGLPEGASEAAPVVFVREWVIDREVVGRTYHRTDKLITVELGG
jgi:hypothetical protein